MLAYNPVRLQRLSLQPFQTMTNSAPATDTPLSRHRSLFAGAASLATASLYWLPDFPFPRALCAVAALSGLLHFGAFLAFPRLGERSWRAINLANILLLAAAMHYSGGILSPFTMLLALVFIAGAGRRSHYPRSAATAAGIYAGLIFLEASGLLPPAPVFPSTLYASRVTTLVIVLSVVGHLMIAASIYDITFGRLRRRLELEQTRKAEMVKKLSSLDAPSQLGLVVSKIAHDLRGPLGAFLGFVKLIEEDETVSAESREDCRCMREELGRLSTMIDRMLQYARPGRGTPTPLDLRDLLESVLSVVRFHPGAERIEFRRDFQGQEPMRVRGDRDALQQVCFNILKNAVEALEGRQAPSVEVTLRRCPPRLLIGFQDNGRGVPPEVLRRLTKESVSTKEGGMGIGLLIAGEIVQGLAGTISVESEEGRGTKVLLDLPELPEPGQISARR